MSCSAKRPNAKPQIEGMPAIAARRRARAGNDFTSVLHWGRGGAGGSSIAGGCQMDQVMRSRSTWRAGMAIGACVLAGGVLSACSSSSPSGTSGSTSAKVLLVGTFNGHAGQYSTIQSAVNAEQPGDWILVAPGDYHETADEQQPPTNAAHGEFGGVLITKSNLHLRGMNRATVIVDGTKAGAASCSANPADQNFGPMAGGKADGRNGIVVWKADNVSIE